MRGELQFAARCVGDSDLAVDKLREAIALLSDAGLTVFLVVDLGLAAPALGAVPPAVHPSA